MAQVMQLYALSANEAMKLSDQQVEFMVQHAEMTARAILDSSPQFKQALNQGLAGVKRTVRAMLEDDEGSGGPVGQPPGI